SLFKKSNSLLPIVVTALLTVNPWHLHLSRGAFEVSLALFLIVLGVYIWVIAAEKKKTPLFLLALIPLFASVYTYNIARVFTPLLFFILILFYRQYFLGQRKKLALIIFFVAFLLIPLGIQVFGIGGVSAVKGTLITSSPVVQAPMIEMREYMTGVLPSGFVSVMFNIPVLTLWHYVANVISYLSVD